MITKAGLFLFLTKLGPILDMDTLNLFTFYNFTFVYQVQDIDVFDQLHVFAKLEKGP